MEAVGGKPVGLGGVDPGFLEDLAGDGGPVGAVLGEGLAGPLPRDQDAAAAEAEVFVVDVVSPRSSRLDELPRPFAADRSGMVAPFVVTG